MDMQNGQENIQGAIKHLENEFAKIQVGRASSAMVEGILVSAYGTDQPLKSVATITTPDPKTIMIQPWDKSVLSSIEKAIRDHAELGLNPMNDGHVIRLNLPQPTEERRREMVKVAHAKGEEAKVSIRNARHKSHAGIEVALKNKEISEDEYTRLRDQLQKTVDDANKKVDELVTTKEKEILTV
ncbi:MAG: ribosome recycling factor [bacterium]|nr:ribosome recycling factor [bacterium]